MRDIVHVVHIDTSRHMGPRQSVPSLCKAEVTLGADAIVLNVQERSQFVPETECWSVVNEAEMKRTMTSARLVHFNGVFHINYMWLPGLCRRAGVPYIVCPRGNLVRTALRSQRPVRKAMAQLMWVRRFVKHAAALHFLTEAEAEVSVTYGHRFVVAPNGCEVPRRLDAGRRRGKTIVFVGRIDVHHKGLDRLIRFADRWREYLMDTGWKINVYGPDHRGGRRRLERMIREKGLTEIVKLSPAVSGVKKGEVLTRARLFVHPSRFEGQPQAVMEAMASGCPVAVSEGTNMQSEVVANGCGIAWEQLSDEAPRMLDRLRKEEAVRAMGGAGRSLITRRYSWAAVARESLQAFEAGSGVSWG